MDKSSKTCKNCNAGDTLKMCGRCGRAYYCSTECQKANWKMHKFECKQTAVLTGRCTLQSVVGEKCKYCGKKSDGMKKCGSCFNMSYCSKECQKSDWKDHKLSCIAVNPLGGTNIEAKIAERLDILSTKEGTNDSHADKANQKAACHTIYEAKDVAKEMFPTKEMISKFELIPKEMYGFRLCQGQQVLVAALTGYHPERKRHGMMLCDEDDISSFIIFHVLTIPHPEPFFKWEDMKPGNFVCVVDPCFQAFPGGFLGLVIDEACDIRTIPGDVVMKEFFNQKVLHSSTYQDTSN